MLNLTNLLRATQGSQSKDRTMTQIAIYKKPEGVAADRTASIIKRIVAYRAQGHFLNDGTEIIPKIETCKAVLDAFELSAELGFHCPLVVSADSYIVKA